jgi:hypothetical protein
MEFRTTVMVEVYRACCPDCGIKMETVPQSPSKARLASASKTRWGKHARVRGATSGASSPGDLKALIKAKPRWTVNRAAVLALSPHVHQVCAVFCWPLSWHLLFSPKFSQSPRPLPKAWKVRSQWAKDNCLSVAEAMPESKYSFIPTAGKFDGVPSFAEQGKHAACAQFAFFNEIEGKTPPAECEKGGPSKAATKAQLIQ